MRHTPFMMVDTDKSREFYLQTHNGREVRMRKCCSFYFHIFLVLKWVMFCVEPNSNLTHRKILNGVLEHV